MEKEVSSDRLPLSKIRPSHVCSFFAPLVATTRLCHFGRFMACYSTAKYWDQRYLSIGNRYEVNVQSIVSHTVCSTPHEWYQAHAGLSKLLRPEHFTIKGKGSKWQPKGTPGGSDSFPLREFSRVLILGCGNSTLGEDLLCDGWTGRIVNMDFSQVVLDQMKERYNESYYAEMQQRSDHVLPIRMEFVHADMTQKMPFADEEFDLVISKGSFDAILTGSKACVRGVVAEIHRILARDHGVFFLVTNGNPDSRLEYLEHNFELNHYWQGVSVHNVPPRVVDGSRKYGNK